MSRYAFYSIVLASVTLAGNAGSFAAPVPTGGTAKPPALFVWPGDNHSSPTAPSARPGDPASRLGQPQARRTLATRRAQAKRDPARNQTVPLPTPQPLPRSVEPATTLTTMAAATSTPSAPATTQAIPPAAPPIPQLAQSQAQSPAPPRARNEPPPEAADGYMSRAAGYLNDAVDYVRGGLSSISSYVPDWRLGWSGDGQDASSRSHEQVLIEAMTAAGYDLTSVTRDGTIVTTVLYTFRQQRHPSASDRVLATRLAAELSAMSGGITGQLEQTMIKNALEGADATALAVQSFELQTKPYPWLRSVAGPRASNR